MRVVLDTNVILAAFLSRGLCQDVLSYVSSYCVFGCSSYILDECDGHLKRKFKVNSKLRQDFMEYLLEISELVMPDIVRCDDLSDVKDLPVLGTGTAFRADFLISGDKELVRLGSFGEFQLLNPRGFWGMVS